MEVVGTTDGLQHKESRRKNIRPNIFQIGAFLFRGTHVGHRTTAVGAVCQLTAGRLGGTLGLIWTGNCEDKLQHNWSLASPSVEDEFVLLEQPLFPQSSL